MTRQKAIEAKCKECTYDELDEGTWRQQVERCDITDCAFNFIYCISYCRLILTA